METMLWALDLVALVGLCFWALKKDTTESSAVKDRKE